MRYRETARGKDSRHTLNVPGEFLVSSDPQAQDSAGVSYICFILEKDELQRFRGSTSCIAPITARPIQYSYALDDGSMDL